MRKTQMSGTILTRMVQAMAKWTFKTQSSFQRWKTPFSKSKNIIKKLKMVFQIMCKFQSFYTI